MPPWNNCLIITVAAPNKNDSLCFDLVLLFGRPCLISVLPVSLSSAVQLDTLQSCLACALCFHKAVCCVKLHSPLILTNNLVVLFHTLCEQEVMSRLILSTQNWRENPFLFINKEHSKTEAAKSFFLLLLFIYYLYRDRIYFIYICMLYNYMDSVCSMLFTCRLRWSMCAGTEWLSGALWWELPAD